MDRLGSARSGIGSLGWEGHVISGHSEAGTEGGITLSSGAFETTNGECVCDALSDAMNSTAINLLSETG